MRAWPALVVLAFALLSRPTPAAAPDELRVLFVGNSLIYTQQLPATLSALARAQPSPPRIVTTSFVAPGGRVVERWQDGHVAEALRGHHWDALVIQEQGGLLACLAQGAPLRTPECRASEQAHRELAALARGRGVRVWLLGTWTGNATDQAVLDRETRQLASRLSAGFISTGPSLHGYARGRGERDVFPDGMHPSLTGTLIVAARVYRALAGVASQAVDVTLDFPLLASTSTPSADTPLEQQAARMPATPALRIQADAMAPLLRAAEH